MMHDKSFWHAILENKGAIPDGESLTDLTQELQGYLSHADPQLRDEFGYQLLTHWILSGSYEANQLKDFLTQWQDDLTIGIDEKEKDSLLKRSFAALMLSILVYSDIKDTWMSDSDFETLATASLNYLLEEKDLRDYIAPVGWYHATAHTADILKFMARHPKSDALLHQQMLDTIASKLMHPQHHIYTHGEDERLALVILDIAKRALITQKAYHAWLDTLISTKDTFKPAIHIDENTFGALQNVTSFLRALHIILAKNRHQLEAEATLEYAVFERLLTL